MILIDIYCFVFPDYYLAWTTKSNVQVEDSLSKTTYDVLGKCVMLILAQVESWAWNVESTSPFRVWDDQYLYMANL